MDCPNQLLSPCDNLYQRAMPPYTKPCVKHSPCNYRIQQKYAPNSSTWTKKARRSWNHSLIYRARNGTNTKYPIPFAEKSDIGILLNNLVEYLQIESGIERAVLSGPTYCCLYITSMFLTSVWEFMSKYPLSIHNIGHRKIKKQRETDSFLMDEFTSFYKPSEFKKLNACRIWMHAITMSDIVNIAGNKIQDEYWKGTQQIISTLIWPKQMYPPTEWWTLWRSAIKMVYSIEKNDLLTPIGKWRPEYRHKQYPNTISEDHSILWKKCGDTYIQLERSAKQWLCYTLTSGSRSSLPLNSYPVEISAAKYNYLKVIQPRGLVLETIPPAISPFHQQIDPKIICLFPWLKLPTDNFASINALAAQNSLYCGCDGSAKSHNGAYGYVILGSSNATSLEGKGVCPPQYWQSSSLHAETFGAIALATEIKISLSPPHLWSSKSTYTVFSDNEELITRINDPTILTTRRNILSPELYAFLFSNTPLVKFP